MTEVLLQLNDLLVPPPNEECRLIEAPHIVLFIDATTDRVFIMNVKESQKPVEISYHRIIASLEAGELSKGKFQLPAYMEKPERFMSEKQLAIRDKKYAVILPILQNLEHFLLKDSNGKLIEQCLGAAKKVDIPVRRTHIYDWLYRYFRAGCNINAFLRKPGSGSTANKKYAGKTGPKRSDGVIGRMRTKSDERNIEYIVNKYIKCNAPLSYPNAYAKYEDRFASTPKVDPITGEVSRYDRGPAEQRLTQQQFTHYARAYANKNIESIRIAQGKTDKFNKDKKGLKGNLEEFYADGPGHVYQVDETPLNIELVDEFDQTRQRRMGKPTCYSVVDLFSRAWVALLLTFAKASAHTAREVLFVAFRNKEQFCAEIGVTLSEPWNISGKCRIIMVDNGEFKAELERAISRDAQIEQVYNTEGNSQQKGSVERRHKTLEDFLYGLLPGAGRKNIADYLKRKLRNDALINIRELYQILIDFATRYNNYYPLTSLPLTKQMRLDGVPPIPMKKFEWGLKNRPGYLKPATDNELYLSLLEVGEVTVYRDHLFLPGKFLSRKGKSNASQGLRYKCQWTYENGIQDYEKGRGALPRLPCRFMRYSIHTIFIETTEGLKPATLQGVDALYEYMSDEATLFDKKAMAIINNDLKTKHDEKQSETRINAEKVVETAKEQQVEMSVNQANNQDISANKAEAIKKEVEASQQQFDKATGVASNDTDNTTEAPTDQEGETRPANEEASQKPDPTTPTDQTAAIFAKQREERRRKKGR